MPLSTAAPEDKPAVSVQRLLAVFPELSPARGWVSVEGRAGVSHRWCVTPDGSVVDPKYSGHPIHALTYVESAKEPLGECLYCGEFRFDIGVVTCTPECSNKLMGGSKWK